MWKWGGITFAIGMLLLYFEYSTAKKKKEGVTWTDRQKMWGIFWVTCVLSAMVAGMVYMAG